MQFSLYYHTHSIFKIPNNKDNNIEQMSIQGSDHTLTNKSAILFKHQTTQDKINIDNYVPANNFKFISLLILMEKTI